MKKSIYVFGKVYDLEKELLEDIQNDVRARIKEHTSVDIPCYINIDEANKQVDVILIRGCSQNFDNNTILGPLEKVCGYRSTIKILFCPFIKLNNG